MVVAISVAAITGNQFGDELVQVRVMTYEQNPFPAGMLRDELLECWIIPVRRECRRGENRGFKTDFGGYKLR